VGKRLAQRREKILRYISEHNTDTLVFQRPDHREALEETIVRLESDGSNIDDLVMEIITKSTEYYSYNPNMNNIETGYGRMRSSLDIWRHAKSVLPDIDIFTIMESIYNVKELLYGHYCITVKRAVFRLPNSWSKGVGNFLCREYGIKLSTWRKLHE